MLIVVVHLPSTGAPEARQACRKCPPANRHAEILPPAAESAACDLEDRVLLPCGGPLVGEHRTRAERTHLRECCTQAEPASNLVHVAHPGPVPLAVPSWPEGVRFRAAMARSRSGRPSVTVACRMAWAVPKYRCRPGCRGSLLGRPLPGPARAGSARAAGQRGGPRRCRGGLRRGRRCRTPADAGFRALLQRL